MVDILCGATSKSSKWQHGCGSRCTQAVFWAGSVREKFLDEKMDFLMRRTLLASALTDVERAAAS